MKGLYIAAIDNEKYSWSVGVSNKIRGQINAFSDLNVDMSYLCSENCKIVLNENSITTKNIVSRFGFTVFAMDLIRNIFDKFNKEILEFDFIYIRYAFANPYLLKLVKYLRKNNKKVFLEIPTYPYEDEFKKNISGYTFKTIDKYILKSLSKYVYRFVMTNDLTTLYKSKVINIFNGIDEKSITSHNSVNKGTDNVINMIAIANLSPWHGYDRVIEGLNDYYKKHNNKIVRFYVVGDGESKEDLENLVEKYNLQDEVIFLGVKRGEELNDAFENMHIGISSLALFRAGGGHDPIKSKEYIGRGIPVILGYKDRALSGNLPFVFNIPEDNSSLNVDYIVKRYENLKVSSDEIKEFARNNLTWKSQMKKVIDELK
jgi:glycosyltransferase involved in cell wall biosynthesis